jgi:hypothetical protein
VGAKKLARRLQNENVDLAIGSEGGSKQVVAEVFFVSSPKRSSKRAAIVLHEELAITPTWHVNCQMVRSRQPTGVLVGLVVRRGDRELSTRWLC